MLLPVSILLLSHLAAPAGTRQVGCVAVSAADAARGAQAAAGFGTLFQQHGVDFRARIDNEGTPRTARLAIANHSGAPVEVSFVVGMEVRDDSAGTSSERSLGQRCVRLEPNQTVAGLEGALDFATPTGSIAGLRIRYVSITNLRAAAASGAPRPVQGAAPIPSRPAGCDPATGACPPEEELPPGPLLERLPAATSGATTSAGGAEASAPSAAAVSAPGAVERGRSVSVRRSLPRWDVTPREIPLLLLRLVCAVLLSVAGIALAIPVGGALYLVLLLAPLSHLRRTLRPRSTP